MTDLLLFLLLTAITILLLALPFLRRQAAPARETYDLAVYEDQLAELDRDLERGVIDAEAARAARLEVQRRIIALDGKDRPTRTARTEGRFGAVVTAALVIAVPLASVLVYFQTGRPHLKDAPLATRILPEQQVAGQNGALESIRQIQEQLEGAPEDGALWTMLARTQKEAGLYGDAAGSFTKAIEIIGDPLLRIELGEVIVATAEGLVPPGALEQFRTALESAPNDPRARYYLGLAAAQEGDVDGAVDGWSQLLETSPSNAPWRSQIIQAIRGVLESNGRPADEIVANLPAGGAPAIGAPAGAGSDTAEAHSSQNDQIRSMVEGLAARLADEPDDIEGWLMLGRSRMVLEEPELAKAAFERAKDLAPEDPEVLIAYAASLLEPSAIPGSDPIVGEDAASIYEKLVTLIPDDPEPRWLLGLAAAQNGDQDKAVSHWRDLLGLIEEGSEDKKVVEARIAALESGEPAAALAAGAPSLAPGAASTAGGASGTATAGGATTGDAASPGGNTGGSTDPSNARPGTGQDRAAMAALSPDERSEQIRTMVDGLAARLEEDPSDIEGWLRLAQSRAVLDEPEAAKAAYMQAMEQAPENTDVLRAYAGSLLGAPHPETDVPEVSEDAADLYRKIIAITPDDPEAHWYLGLAAVQEGTVDEAKTHWQRVLDLLGPDHPNYAAVQSSLQQVETRTQ